MDEQDTSTTEPIESAEPAESDEQKPVVLPETIVIKDFADKLGLPVTKIIAELMKSGIMSGQNERIDFDTASIVAQDFGFLATKEDAVGVSKDTELLEQATREEKGKMKPRPPVVVVMGHVDHGKTKLLDAIRKTDVVAQETGGITQRIGAYQIKEKNRLITFIDTPGHEAFSAMRSRGARVADVAILVVAADDGVKPQTKEALKIIKESNIPFVVAINKIDKPDADVKKVKKQLADLNIMPEDWGGNIVMAEISAKQNKGIKELLEVVLLVADLEKNSLKANPDRLAIGTIIESHVDPGEGPVATVVVQSGTLHKGDLITVGNVYGKVKALKNHYGESLIDVPPSAPAKIMGLKGAPLVGDILQAVKDLIDIKKRVKKYQMETRTAEPTLSVAQPESKDKPKNVKIVPVILKADTLGSLEALVGALQNIKNEEIEVKIIQQGLGNITEADVLAAETGKASLYGFNTLVSPAAEAVAKGKHIEPQIFKIIYDLVNDVRTKAEALLTPEIIRTDLGKLKVLAIFRTEHNAMIVGGQVTAGKATDDSLIQVLRNDEEIGKGKIVQLQSQKRAAKDVLSGSECGIKFAGPPVIAEGDTLVFYHEEIRRKTLG
ncbi:MAG: translation initiation factor IF-2 [bacterium]